MVETNIQSRLSHKYTEHFFPCSKKNQHPKQSRNNFRTWWFWCVALRHLSRICQCSVHCPLSPSRLTAQVIPTTTHDPLTHQYRLEGYWTNDHAVRSNAAMVTCISCHMFRCVKIFVYFFFIAHLHVCLYILVGNLHIKWIKKYSLAILANPKLEFWISVKI